ncbi:hypothetical protein GJ496_007689, partial [Pomphorhynchus laevis]
MIFVVSLSSQMYVANYIAVDLLIAIVERILNFAEKRSTQRDIRTETKAAKFNDVDKKVVRQRHIRLNDNMYSVNKQENSRPIHRGLSRHERISNLKESNAVEQQSFKPSNRLDVTIAAVDESLPKVPKKLEDTSQEDNSRNITTGTVVLAKCNAGFFPALIIEKPNSENITVRNFINDSTITVKVNDISILDESKIYQMKMLLPGLDMSKVEEYMRNPHYYSNWTPPCDTEINILSSEDECLQEKDYFLTNLLNFLEASDITFVRSPLVNGVSCDLCVLYRLVNKYGGWSKVCKKHLWGDIHRAMCLPTSGDEECGIELEKIYHKYLRAFYDMNRKLGSPTVASHKGVKRSVPAVTRVSQRLFKPSSSDLRVSVNQKSPLPILQHKTRRNASRSHSPTNKQARIFNITPDNNLQCSKSIATKFTINQIDVDSFVKVIWSTLDSERNVYIVKVIDKILDDIPYLQQSISDESSCTTAEIINCLSSNFYDYDSTTTNISPRM